MPRETIIPALVRRMLRYGGVGIAISLIYSLIVIAAVHVLPSIGPTMASVLAFAIVLPISWFAHGTISFADRPYDAFQPLRFALSTTASFIVAVGGMYWITEIAGRSYLLGIAWNWLIIPTANFLAYMLSGVPGKAKRETDGVMSAGMTMNDMYIYDSAFQNMAATGSAHAAARIISFVQTIVPIESVIDVGCARGTWLRQWRAHGARDIAGVDGDYVDRSKLEIDPGCFVVRDLAERFNLERQFDLAQSLEVAEHLSGARAATFVSDLVAHAPMVLFSAAPPGQGGENHLNEQPGEYWRQLFLAHDYVAIDCLRPLLAREPNIPMWYRYNIMLYVRRDQIGQIAPFARQFELRPTEPIADVSPLAYKLRKRIVRSLPQSVCNVLARWNARRFPNG